MTSLQSLQQAFMKGVVENDVSDITPLVYTAGISAAARLSIYQKNVHLSLVEVLHATYPMVRSLVGERFFDRVAKDYAKQTPSRSGNIDVYGEHFSAFLQQQEALSSLPYVADIAQYEWLSTRTHHAADIQIDEPQILSMFDKSEELLAHCTVVLIPSLHLLASDYPLDTIITVIEKDIQHWPPIPTLSHPCYLLLSRPEYRVERDILTPAEYHFIHTLIQHHTLEDAYNAAIVFDEHFDAATGLSLLLKRKAIVKLEG